VTGHTEIETREGRLNAAFDHLIDAAASCRVCPRMAERRRVLTHHNGRVPSPVLFVAEAPGRLGGERTGIPMSGDQTGKNFQKLLTAAGLTRDDVFVTNAVLCNPRNVESRNAKPTRDEIHNCSRFLASTLDLVAPAFVVTLGAVALDALKLIAPHETRLSHDVGVPIRWHGRWLVPLYHPSPRAQLHRSFERQLEDFTRLGAWIREAADGARPSVPAPVAPERM
jgi:uracil-DNA glycosylase family 4